MSEKYTTKQKKEIAVLVEKLRKRCNTHGFSLRKITLLVGASPGTISKWFRGGSFPSEHHVFWIKKFMGIKP